MTDITLRVLEGSQRPACGMCDGPAAIEIRGYTYCLHCTDVALERADISHSTSVAALRRKDES